MWQLGMQALRESWRLGGASAVGKMVLTKLYWRRHYVRFRVDLGNWNLPPDPPGPIEVREGRLDELARIREAAPAPLSREFYEDRFHGARRFYLGFCDGRLGHISWVFTRSDRTPQIDLAEGEAELNGAYTIKEFRGRSLLPAVERAILRDLKREGYRTVYTHVAVDNLASQRGVVKAGFQPEGILTWRWILGTSWRQYRRTHPPEAPAAPAPRIAAAR
jgi:RimJ/RimL family protein N-acetyltransferase